MRTWQRGRHRFLMSAEFLKALYNNVWWTLHDVGDGHLTVDLAVEIPFPNSRPTWTITKLACNVLHACIVLIIILSRLKQCTRYSPNLSAVSHDQNAECWLVCHVLLLTFTQCRPCAFCCFCCFVHFLTNTCQLFLPNGAHVFKNYCLSVWLWDFLLTICFV